MSNWGVRIARSIARAVCAWGALCLLIVPLPAATAAAAAPTPQPFGHACTLEPYGVRFCPAATLSQRVPSFDGAPLDVDVTLPTSGSGPWPTIVMASPTGGAKTFYESANASGAAGFGRDYSNVWFADQGYAVVTYSFRGTFGSCGNAQSRVGYAACSDVGFTFVDQRYDARDVQWLLGLLVDEGIADPTAIGVTGVSLGSIVALELDILDDRIRLLNGTFAPWTSPHGIPLHIGAVYTNSSISDVLDAAAPDGRFVSFQPQTAINDNSPVGVIKLSFATVFAAGTTPGSGYWDIPPHPGAFDLPAGVALTDASEPDSPAVAAFAHEIDTYHQAIGIPIGTGTAPVLIEDGWDDIPVNGVTQAIRMADYLAQMAPNANVALQLMDVGHPLSSGKAADTLTGFAQATAFFNHYLQGRPGGPPPGSVTAYTATCPASAPSSGPYTAQGMEALDPGAVRFSSAAPQSVSTGGNPQIGVELDWLVAGEGGSAGACQKFSAINWPGTAVYTHLVTQTFTMLGLPTMRLHVDTTGNHGQLDARLWNVAPDGMETYVTRGTYALTDNQQGTITWQMWGGGYTFHKGDTIRVELLAQDAPTERPSLSTFAVTVSDFMIALPSHSPTSAADATPLITGPSATPNTEAAVNHTLPQLLLAAMIGVIAGRRRRRRRQSDRMSPSSQGPHRPLDCS